MKPQLDNLSLIVWIWIEFCTQTVSIQSNYYISTSKTCFCNRNIGSVCLCNSTAIVFILFQPLIILHWSSIPSNYCKASIVIYIPDNLFDWSFNWKLKFGHVNFLCRLDVWTRKFLVQKIRLNLSELNSCSCLKSLSLSVNTILNKIVELPFDWEKLKQPHFVLSFCPWTLYLSQKAPPHCVSMVVMLHRVSLVLVVLPLVSVWVVWF